MLPGIEVEELSKSSTCAPYGYWGNNSHTEEAEFDTVRSIVAARAWSALAARFALTNPGRFRLRRTAHRADTSLVCPGLLVPNQRFGRFFPFISASFRNLPGISRFFRFLPPVSRYFRVFPDGFKLDIWRFCRFIRLLQPAGLQHGY